MINSNTTNVWTPGPINALQLQAMDDRNVGLEACWYGSFYSDASYDHSPVPGQTNTSTGNSSDQTVGIHLWYATNSTSFDSVGWTYGDSTWTQQQSFDGYNGHAGVGCYSWGPGSETYVFFINLDNEINILWKELNTTLVGNATHPIDTWTKSKSPTEYPNEGNSLIVSIRWCIYPCISEQLNGLHELPLRPESRSQHQRLQRQLGSREHDDPGRSNLHYQWRKRPPWHASVCHRPA